ncbi:MAG: tetratricopeptide repeat protein [Treponemataceae bacterium]
MKITIFLLLSLLSSQLFAQKIDALSLYRSARDLESIGKLEEANAIYEQAYTILHNEIQMNNRNMDSYVVCSWVLFRLKRYQESADLALSGLKINSSEYRLMESLGESFFYLSRYEEALSYFERYLAGLPRGDRVSTAYFFVGEIYRLMNKFEHADIAYSMAVTLDKNIPLWWYRLGLAREQAGSKEHAKAAFERALALRPNYLEVQQALDRL